MKKVFNLTGIIALLSTLTLCFVSCQPKNQPSDPNDTDKTGTQTQTDEATIVGQWEAILFEQYEDGETTSYPAQDVYFTFSENNSCTVSADGSLQKGTYTLVGKNLIMQISGETMKWTVRKLTKDALVLRMTEGDGWVDYTFKRVKDDSGTTQTDEATIVGQWEAILFEQYEDGETTSYPAQDVYFTFSENNSCTVSADGSLQKGTYTLVGKSLIMQISGETMKWTVRELTKDALVLRMTEGDGWVDYTFKRVKDDSGTTQTDEATIVGQWEAILFEQYEDGETTSYPAQDVYFTFSENNSCTVSADGSLQKGTYTLVGKSLIMQISGETMKWTVRELTKDALVLRMTEGDGWVDYTFKRVK